MKPEEIKARCLEIWPKRWKELAPVSDSRAEFVKEVTKKKPDIEFIKTLELAIVAQTKHWRLQKSTGKKMLGIPRLSQWVKDCKYEDEFIDESAMDIKTRQEAMKCSIATCSNDVHGSMFKYCAEHIPNAHSDLLAQAWTRQGISKSSPTFVNDCRLMCRTKMNNLLGKGV